MLWTLKGGGECRIMKPCSWCLQNGSQRQSTTHNRICIGNGQFSRPIDIQIVSQHAICKINFAFSPLAHFFPSPPRVCLALTLRIHFTQVVYTTIQRIIIIGNIKLHDCSYIITWTRESLREVPSAQKPNDIDIGSARPRLAHSTALMHVCVIYMLLRICAPRKHMNACASFASSSFGVALAICIALCSPRAEEDR